MDLKKVDEYESLSSGVEHFGWSKCVDSILARIRSTSSFSSRVNLVVSVSYHGMTSAEMDPMLDALVSLYPWTDVQIPTEGSLASSRSTSEIGNFEFLLLLASRSSPEKVLHLASVVHVREMVLVVAPAVMNAVHGHEEDPSQRALLLRVLQLFEPMLAQAHNEWHAKIRLPTHCAVCDELQSFLSSPATEKTMAITSSTQYEHIGTVLHGAVNSPARVLVERTGEMEVRLVKKRHITLDGLYYPARLVDKRLRTLLSPNDEAQDDSSEQ